MSSPNNTVVSLPSQFIFDSAGNAWSIINGQVAVNNVPDPTTSNVIELAYENGQVWQKNTDNLWWAKTTPSDSWGNGTTTDPIPNQQASANGSVITQAEPNAALTDASGNNWSILDGQVALNGVADPTTARVIELAYVNGQLWQENADGLWWGKTKPSDSWGSGTSISPVSSKPPSDSGSIVTAPDQGGLTDAAGNVWSIQNGQVTVNGAADATTARVIELAYVDGEIWQENADGLWWGKTSPSAPWSPTYGTATSPVAGASRVWLGASDVASNFETPGLWSPFGIPQVGDRAIIHTGIVQVLDGDAAGVNFTITGGDLAFQGSTANQATNTDFNIGSITGSGDVGIGYPDHSVTLTTTGIDLQSGTLYVGEFVSASHSTLVIDGDSALRQGANLTVSDTGTAGLPRGQVENDGTMTVDGSTLDIGTLTGNGVIDVTNNSNVFVLSASSGETFDLQSGHLTVYATPIGTSNAMQFLAPITDFGASSELTLANTHATALEYGGTSPSSGEWLLYDGSSLVATLLIKTQAGAALQANYDPTTRSVNLATHDLGGQTLPILAHTS